MICISDHEVRLSDVSFFTLVSQLHLLRIGLGKILPRRAFRLYRHCSPEKFGKLHVLHLNDSSYRECVAKCRSSAVKLRCGANMSTR